MIGKLGLGQGFLRQGSPFGAAERRGLSDLASLAGRLRGSPGPEGTAFLPASRTDAFGRAMDGAAGGASGDRYESLESLLGRTETVELELPGADGFRAALALREVEYSAQESIRGAGGLVGSRRIQAYGMDLQVRIEADTPEGLAKGIKALQDHYSPEKVSERIVRFALSKFQASTDDPEAARSEREDYAGWIQGVVDSAFEEAQELLGGLWPVVGGVVEDTHNKVGQLFQAFVDGGLEAITALVESWRAAREAAAEADESGRAQAAAAPGGLPGVLDLEA